MKDRLEKYTATHRKTHQMDKCQTLENTEVGGKTDQHSDPLYDSKEHQHDVCDLLSEIEEAKQKVVDMDRKRKQSKMQCIAKEEDLVAAKDKIASLEDRIRAMEEYGQLKTNEANYMESHLQQVKSKHRKLELKYESAQSEIESCQKLLIELKTVIIEKVRHFMKNMCVPFGILSLTLTCTTYHLSHRIKKSNQRRVS